MKKLLALGIVLLVSSPALSAPFYLAGTQNGWTANGDIMSEIIVDTYYTLSTTQAGGQEFKITDGTWDNAWPANNVQINYDAGATAEVRFWPGNFNDGWLPTANRVGYEWLGLHGWDIMGSFNGWASPLLDLTDQGNGLFTGQLVVATPGTYEFKYRKTGDWTTAIGDLEGTGNGGNIVVVTTLPNQVLDLGIDIGNGRYLLPEPTSLAIIGLGAFGLMRRRR